MLPDSSAPVQRSGGRSKHDRRHQTLRRCGHRGAMPRVAGCAHCLDRFFSLNFEGRTAVWWRRWTSAARRNGPAAQGTSLKSSTQRLSLLFLFTVLLIFSSQVAAAQQGRADQPERILLLHSESPNMPAIREIDSAFRDLVALDRTKRRVIYSEYLDQARFPDAQLQREQIAWLRRKYRDRKIDVTVSMGPLAVMTMVDAATSITPGVPVVAWIVDLGGNVWVRPAGAITGMVTRFDAAGTVRDALTLFPEAEELVVIAGMGPIDAMMLHQARGALESFERRPGIRYVTGLSLSQFIQEVRSLSERSLVLYLNVQADALGNEYVPRDVLRAIATESRAPVFGLGSTLVGAGIVGGRVVDYAARAGTMAELVLRVLRGENAAEIPIVRWETHLPMFDVRELRRWRVPLDRLPADSQLRFNEQSIWQRYRWQIISALTLCLLEALLIAGLLVQRRKRGRAEQLLAERLRFETVLADTSRTFTDVTGERVGLELQRWLGRIGLAAGARMVALMQFDPSGVRLDPIHYWRRTRPGNTPSIIVGGTEIECIGRGVVVTRPLESLHLSASTLVLVPLAVGGRTWGALALETSSATPFGEGVPTARLRVLGEVLANALARNRAAEELVARTQALTESHEEYRRLADRLIESQENERKRIARELHDDITQRLTLIGLEAGEIRLPQGEAAAVPRNAIERLTEQLSTLIGDVTRLSHRLHPSLLERIGLPAAVRALCRDLSGQQGLDVSFSEQDMPQGLPEAQSLAAYRVAQEALRNALKHSGARQVSVHLAVEDNTLALEVSDDGHGFDTARSWAEGGLGLLSMTERVQVLDGTLTVQSGSGSGTTVRVVLPLAEDPESRHMTEVPEQLVDVRFPARPSDA